MRKLSEWLAGNIGNFYQTGSSRVIEYAKANDRDFVLCVEDIPEDLRHELADYCGEYEGNFYNVKIDPCDFIICHTRDQVTAFMIATEIASDIVSRGGALGVLLHHKESRTELFNAILSQLNFYGEPSSNV